MPTPNLRWLPLLYLFDWFWLPSDLFGRWFLGSGLRRHRCYLSSTRRSCGFHLCHFFRFDLWRFLRFRRFLRLLFALASRRLLIREIFVSFIDFLGRRKVLNLDYFRLLLNLAVRHRIPRIYAQIIHKSLRRRQALANLLLLAVHPQLSLVDLVFQVVYCLHYPIGLLP